MNAMNARQVFDRIKGGWRAAVSITLAAALLMHGAPAAQAAPRSQVLLPTLEAEAVTVWHRLSAKRLKPLKVGKDNIVTVNVGEGINVSNKGRAWLYFSDALKVHIFRGTKLDFSGGVDPRQPFLAQLRLLTGTIFGQEGVGAVTGQRLQVETEWATITALGTEFWVNYNPRTRVTWAVVRKGSVRVTSRSGESVTVPERWQTWVRAGEAPEPPVPASRGVIGGLFPRADQLSGGLHPDGWLLDHPQCLARADVELREQPLRSARASGKLTAGERFDAKARSEDGRWLQGVDRRGREVWIELISVLCGQLDTEQLAGLTPVRASVRVTPAVGRACPMSFTATARITSDSAGTVTYQWVTNTGARGQASVRFAKPGTRQVRLRIPMSRNGSGWAQLRVLSPESRVSNRANFALRCPPFRVTRVTAGARATRPVFSIPYASSPKPACRPTLRVSGRITTNAAGVVRYQWERNGVRSRVNTVRFTRAGSRSVGYSIRLGGASRGTVRLIVLSPNAVGSGRAGYAAGCRYVVDPPTPTPTPRPYSVGRAVK